MYNINSGYYNYSMSNRAVDAYREGKKPLSKWTKSDILEAVRELIYSEEIAANFNFNLLKKVKASRLKKLCLHSTEYHHTSKYFNRTDFYSIDVDYLESLTDSDLYYYLEEQKKEKEQKEAGESLQYVSVYFYEWEGRFRNFKSKKFYTRLGIQKSGWVYLLDPVNFKERKRIDGKGIESITVLSKCRKPKSFNAQRVKDLKKKYKL